MNKRYRYIRALTPEHRGARLFLIVPMIILCSLALIAPLNATQRMVIAEEYTNSG